MSVPDMEADGNIEFSGEMPSNHRIAQAFAVPHHASVVVPFLSLTLPAPIR